MHKEPHGIGRGLIMGGESLLMVSLNIYFVFGVEEMGLFDLTFHFSGSFLWRVRSSGQTC